MHTDSYAMGVFFGIGVVLLIAAILKFFTKKDFSEKKNYDERQIIARGQAIKYAYYTIIYYFTAYALLDLAEIKFCNNFVGIIAGIFISFGVFACTAIVKDAYIGINQNIKWWVGLNIAVIVSNIAGSIPIIIEGKIIENGMLSHGITNILVVIVFTVVLVTMLVHNKRRNNQAEDDQ